MRAGEFHVGLRTDDTQLLDTLGEMYDAHLVDDDRALDDFGLSVGDPADRGVRAVPRLEHGRCPVLRSRSTTRLIRRFDVELGHRIADSVPTSVGLDGVAALVGNGRAALVPSSVVERSSAVERMVARAGAGIAESVGLRLDPPAAELVVPAGFVGLGAAAVEDDPLAVTPGRYGVVGVFWLGHQHAVDERPATALLRLLTHVGDPVGLSRGEVLHGLAAMRDTFSPHPLGSSGTADLAPVLDRVS